jgi:hypothetical protein
MIPTIRKYQRHAVIWPEPGISNTTPPRMTPIEFAMAPLIPYTVNPRLSWWRSMMDTIRRKEAGRRQDAKTPLMARKTKKEYWSWRKDITRLVEPRPMKPMQKTCFDENRSQTRPQNKRQEAKVTPKEVCNG